MAISLTAVCAGSSAERRQSGLAVTMQITQHQLCAIVNQASSMQIDKCVWGSLADVGADAQHQG